MITIIEQTLSKLELWDREKPVVVKCTVQEQEETKKLKADKILHLEEAHNEKVEFAMQKADTSDPLILLLDTQSNENTIIILREAALKHKGKRELRIRYQTKTQELEMISSFYVHSQIKEELKELQWVG